MASESEVTSYRQVWKYPLEHTFTELNVPHGWRVLHVGLQGKTPTVWIEVDPNAINSLLVFLMIGTGHPVPKNATYRGTVLMYCDTLVMHVYEVVSKEDKDA